MQGFDEARTKEWLRTSFLNVDKELETKLNELADLRR